MWSTWVTLLWQHECKCLPNHTLPPVTVWHVGAHELSPDRHCMLRLTILTALACTHAKGFHVGGCLAQTW